MWLPPQYIAFAMKNGGGVYGIFTYYILHIRVLPNYKRSLDSSNIDTFYEQGIKNNTHLVFDR